jgi:hypothetical protein
MNKRGQFFLIATLVIISLILSFGVVYNRSPKINQDNSLPFLAENIKYETVKTIEYSYDKNSNQGEIESRLKSLIDSYSALNPEVGITLVYGTDSPNTLDCYSIKSGLSCSVNMQTRKVTISSNGEAFYNLNIQKGYNTYVIVQRNLEDERIISYA